jgi:DNA modification methylase
MRNADYQVICGDCLTYLKQERIPDIHLTFLDPPFNQGKDYKYFDDEQNPEVYWGWLKEIIQLIHGVTVDGGAIYFMQREKNVDWMIKVLKETGWTYQNLIIWKKLTSAIPSDFRFGKHYQVIVFATKGEKPRLFNKLRIDYPLRPNYKHKRPSGVFLTDVWDDVRELTSGYFAGDEALRDKTGNRIHKQQSPIELLLRIVLSSTNVGDTVFDPFAGSGTTIVVAHQLERKSIGIEIDPDYVEVIKKRLETISSADSILKYRNYYRFTPELDEVWPTEGLTRYINE